MPFGKNQLQTLKHILENSLQPELLDSHPWIESQIVRAGLTANPALADESPGRRLVLAIAGLFAAMLPSTPPKRGKRLDTSWGEFGILAAQYFAPILFGSPRPLSLRDAWGRIDQSILLFVFGNTRDELAPADRDSYKLVGNESEVAPNSTLSDWHRKGLQRLVEMISARENYLATSGSMQTGIPKDDSSLSRISTRRVGSRLSLVILALIAIGLFKAWKIYDAAILVRQDVTHILELISQPSSTRDRVKAAGPSLSALRQDFSNLKHETQPFFWLGPWLNWVPVYGGELASIQDLATVADSMLVSADITYQATLPLLDRYDSAGLNPADLTQELLLIQLQLDEAQRNLEVAIMARDRLSLESLSPQVRDLILNNVDPLLPVLQTGLAVGLELPRVLGATGEGPKTYLLLAQNEDELRPTGGFITAVGTLLVQDGKIINMDFVNSGGGEDWTKLYPAAPWQLSDYMNSPVLLLRDASWFTNYPTAALYAEYLYSYAHEHSVDGVIAFDQQMLVKILGITGPIQVEGVDYPIDASNVITYMRDAKIQFDESGSGRAGGQDKEFINKIVAVLMDKILNGQVEFEQLGLVLLQALDERHVLLQLDNPILTSVLEQNHWDGSVRPGAGDFLMVVDSNIGFNKTNAVVASSIVYDVDLTNLVSPTSLLTISHKNNAAPIAFCKHWNKVKAEGEQDYPITDCYWNYMRVYRKAGTTLLDATPQFVPDNWMLLKQKNQGQVDILKEEIDGVQAFGTLQVLLGGESMSTSFRFALPADTLSIQSGSNWMVYQLKVQKQPGTLAVPFSLRLRLPKNALIQMFSQGAIFENNDVLYTDSLGTDVEFELFFTLH